MLIEKQCFISEENFTVINYIDFLNLAKWLLNFTIYNSAISCQVCLATMINKVERKSFKITCNINNELFNYL